MGQTRRFLEGVSGRRSGQGKEKCRSLMDFVLYLESCWHFNRGFERLKCTSCSHLELRRKLHQEPRNKILYFINSKTLSHRLTFLRSRLVLQADGQMVAVLRLPPPMHMRTWSQPLAPLARPQRGCRVGSSRAIDNVYNTTRLGLALKK